MSTTTKEDIIAIVADAKDKLEKQVAKSKEEVSELTVEAGNFPNSRYIAMKLDKAKNKLAIKTVHLEVFKHTSLVN